MIYLDVDPNNLEARPGKGPLPAEFAIVGTAPSQTRSLLRDNEPFGTNSLQMLRRLRVLNNREVYSTHLVKVPMSSLVKPRKKEVEHAYPLLIRELKLVQPRRILAMGTVVAQCLCPGFSEMREDHGTLFYNPELEAIVVPTYPFAALGKDPSRYPLMARDFERWVSLPDPTPPHYSVISEIPPIPKNSRVVVDLETTGLKKETDQLKMVGLLINDGDPLILNYEGPRILHQLKGALLSSGSTLIGHNLAFDLDWLQYLTGSYWFDIPLIDTMLVGHIGGEEVLALKHLTTIHTDRPGSRAFGGVEDYSYLTEDLLSTRNILNLWDERGITSAYASKLLCDLLPYILEMKDKGVTLDYKMLMDLTPQYRAAVETTTAALNASAGKTINWGSSQQVVDYLLSKKVPLTEKTDRGAYTVKESVMLALAEKYPVAQEILSLREKQKELEFFESYLERTSPTDSRIHPRMKLTGTRTGRLSCEDPNVQQVKRTGPIKLMYISAYPGGMIGLIDLSQAELRVAALLSGDQKFVEALLSEDVHRELASIGFRKPKDQVTAGERKKSKGVTFGLLYGGSPAGLAARTGLDVKAVEEILQEFFHSFPKLMDFIERTKKEGIREGYVSTPTGRIRDLRGLILQRGESDAERKAINTPIQGTASDVALIIMLNTARRLRELKMKSRVIFGVHDSVLLDIHPEELDRVPQVVQDAFLQIGHSPLADLELFPKLPLVGELVIGKTWAHVESTNENYDKEGNLTYPCTSISTDNIGGVISEREDSTDPEEDDIRNHQDSTEEVY